MKKVAAVIITIVIVLVWIITVKGIGPAGPIQDHIKLGLDIKGGVYVVMEAQTDKTGEELKTLMDQTQSVIDRRVNEMGLSEPVITIEGDNRIRVELPGADDPEQAIETIGRTAQLQFVLADGTVAFDGSQVTGSTVQSDPDHGGYLITLEFNSEGAQSFLDATTTAYNRTISGPFIEGVTAANQIAIMLDGDIISAPSVDNGPISGGSAIITRAGGFGQDEAIQTSTLIRAGALPVQLIEVESSAIGATLGLNALQNSIIGGAIGLLLVVLIMLFMYRIMGLGAVLALMLYVPLVFWIIVGLNGVLTLPGIAGIILSIGMAVDANVIIFARIKEEVAWGKTLRVSTGTGFKKAISTIIDSQITTLIAAVVLYQFGTGPVRGFALTLIIGILVSLFTALMITNVYVNTFVENKFMVDRGWFGVREGGGTQGTRLSRSFNFIKHRKIYYIISVAIIVIGIGVGFGRGFNMGIDFTGGTMLQIDMGKTVATEDVRDSLIKDGIENADIVHFGDGDTGVIIKTTQALTSEDRETIMGTFASDFGINSDALQTFEQFGPSVGKMLTNNAIRAVLLAALFMLIYIIFRFKFKFGVAALITTFHDVAITIAFFGLFNMTINNPFIAAILTVVGYSINDTIVVFDRIRENLGIARKQPLSDLIDTSINQTLVRSIMTSLTTILAIIPLVFFGGESIRQFAVPLIIGIAAGTLSSIFTASSLLFDISKGQYKEGTGGKYKGASGKKDSLDSPNRPKSKKSRSERKGDGAVV